MKEEITPEFKALERLVFLKNYKDSIGKTDFYLHEQAKAWGTAKAIVAAKTMDIDFKIVQSDKITPVKPSPIDASRNQVQLSNITDQNGIDFNWLKIWEQVEIWYGDHTKKQSGRDLLLRLQSEFSSPVKPSIQSGVEDAANKFVADKFGVGAYGRMVDKLRNAFKEGAEWQAQQVKQPVMQWVKASERMPDVIGDQFWIVIRNTDPDNLFTTMGFRTHSDIPTLYFTNGHYSFTTVHGKGNGYSAFNIKFIEWLEEPLIQ